MLTIARTSFFSFRNSSSRRLATAIALTGVVATSCSGGDTEPLDSENLQNTAGSLLPDDAVTDDSKNDTDASETSSESTAEDTTQESNTQAMENLDYSAEIDAQETQAQDPFEGSPYAVFEDPVTGFRAVDIYDADRELYHFDLQGEAMVRAEGEIRQANWLVSGNNVGRNGVFGSYQIRFGTEQGEARAYFTEVTPPTICNLVLTSTDSLSIFRGAEVPPMN